MSANLINAELHRADCPTDEELYAFLKQHCRHERFTAFNAILGINYTQIVTRAKMQALKENGYSCISTHESTTGAALFFNRSLQILDDDATARAVLGALE